MKTYAESKGNIYPFDWNDFLDRAIDGDITEYEKNKAKILSDNWVTCACGNQCEAIPRYTDGSPMDFLLKSFGDDFGILIWSSEFKQAKRTLGEIEKRSAKIINNLRCK